MQTIEAIFENGAIYPIHELDLEEGKRIKITIEEVEEKKVDSAASFRDIAAETGITDLATNIDYYLYGLPKQSDYDK